MSVIAKDLNTYVNKVLLLIIFNISAKMSCIPGDYLMKLVERMPSVLFHSFDVFTIILQCRK